MGDVKKKRRTGLARRVQKLNKKMDESTKEAIGDLQNEPDTEKAGRVIELVQEDSRLSNAEKNELMNAIKDEFVARFNFDNCPGGYQELKQEAKFLAGMTQYSFLLMAQRLLKIRDGELYKEDGYSDFKEFIDKEISISRSTAYNYIDIVSLFGVQALGHGDLKYSKLFPVIPILKAKKEDIPKEKLKLQFLKDIEEKSFRDMSAEASELKLKYGIAKIKQENKTKWIDDFHTKVLKNRHVSEIEKERLKILADDIFKLFNSEY